MPGAKDADFVEVGHHVEAAGDAADKPVAHAIHSLLQTVGKPITKLEGIGVGLPGRINLEEGIAIKYHRIPNWKNIAFGPMLKKTFKTPVFTEHNSSAMGLSTAWKNHPQVSGVVATILVRTGISLGIVQNREIIKSSRYSAGELGHTSINFNGPPCRCGNQGCLETYASGAALSRIVSETVGKHPEWPGAKVLENDMADADLLWDLAISGDKSSHDILETMFTHLCVGIDTVMKLYSPEMITINGIFYKSAPLLMSKINDIAHRPCSNKPRSK